MSYTISELRNIITLINHGARENLNVADALLMAVGIDLKAKYLERARRAYLKMQAALKIYLGECKICPVLQRIKKVRKKYTSDFIRNSLLSALRGLWYDFLFIEKEEANSSNVGILISKLGRTLDDCGAIIRPIRWFLHMRSISAQFERVDSEEKAARVALAACGSPSGFAVIEKRVSGYTNIALDIYYNKAVANIYIANAITR